MNVKTCKRCNVEQPVESFRPDSRIEGGRRNICRACTSKHQKDAKSKKKIELKNTNAHKQMKATANRNALLALMQRYQEEFDKLVEYEMDRLKALEKNPNAKATWHSLV